jgi:hypothetical protein
MILGSYFLKISLVIIMDANIIPVLTVVLKNHIIWDKLLKATRFFTINNN